MAVAPSFGAAQSDDRERAIELNRQALELARANRYDDALPLVREAYRLSQEPGVLLNFAKILDGAGCREEAVDRYRRYAEDPERPEADLAIARADEVAASVGTENEPEICGRQSPDRSADTNTEATGSASQGGETQQSHTTDPAADPIPEPGEDTAVSPVPWVVAAVGAVAVGVGVGFGVAAGASHDDAVAAQTAEERNARVADRDDQALIANVLFGAGGGVLAIGLTWGFVALLTSGGSTDEQALGLVITPRGAAFSGTF